MNRRDWMMVQAAALAAPASAAQSRLSTPQSGDLPLEKYEPKSMLHVPETKVLRARFPVVDFHTHITSARGRSGEMALRFNLQPEECLPVMDRKNLRTMVSLTGGYGDVLREAIRKLQDPHRGRFVVFTEPAYGRASDAAYPKLQADLIADAHKAGAGGLKVLKTLGLYLREQGSGGKLVRIDDSRFDPMWDAAGALNMPVAIHISDPEAFFLPIDRFNERWEELHAHPGWSFHGGDFPSDRDLQEARRNVMRRHPRTSFVCLHVANAENLPYVSECMDSHPNMFVDIAARIGELGRQPRMARKFLEKYQDRVVFGTDASPASSGTPQQIFSDALYEIYFRFLETEDEYFDYSPASIPPQGRWRISGLGLPEQVLRKLYWENAARLLKLSA